MRRTIRSKSMLVVLLASLSMLAGCASEMENTGDPFMDVLRAILPDSPSEQWQKLSAKLRSPDADIRRQGVLMLGQDSFAGVEDVSALLSVIGTGDPASSVRATAIEVLARIDTDGAQLQEVIEDRATDDSRTVRQACVVALGRYPYGWGSDVLIDRLNNDTETEVRATAASALKHYRDRRALSALVAATGDVDFQLAYEARNSLKTITGEDFEYDQQLWQQWLVANVDSIPGL
ncbi:MAG: HEAT repeat domain-containing protein [Sedimentisphaerales bacterium]|nr:HEAT repeat domain-containing protein [Sedimentisphaerales bacterium]